jgi:ABC-type nitrate/sulfonate/bicarbonate transport system substrate-binding protein
MRKLLYLLLTMSLLMTLASCGDDEGASTTTAPTGTTAATTTSAAPGTTAATTTTEATTTTSGYPCGWEPGRTLRVAMVDPDMTKVAALKGLALLEERCGITVERTDFSGAPDTFRPLASGDVDVVVATSLGTLIAYAGETSGSVKYIVGHHQTTDYILVSAPQFNSLDELIGKKIGISAPGAYADTMTRYMLLKAGYQPEQFEFVQIGTTGPRMAAILAGQIDAGPAHAADAITYIQEQGFKNLFSYGDVVKDYIAGGAGALTIWLEANPEMAQAIVDTQIDAARWAATDRQGFLDYSLTVIPEADVPMFAREAAYDIYMAVSMFAVNGAMDQTLLDATIEAERYTGGLATDAPDPSVWADPRYVEDYLARNGRS